MRALEHLAFRPFLASAHYRHHKHSMISIRDALKSGTQTDSA